MQNQLVPIFWCILVCMASSLLACKKSNNTYEKKSHEPVKNLVNRANVTQKNQQHTNHVNAYDYRQFWLWAPPKSSQKSSLPKMQMLIKKASTFYVLQGEIRTQGVMNKYVGTHRSNITARLMPQGVGVLKLPKKKVWLVYRASSAEWHQSVLPKIISRLQTWKQMGNTVQGIQIDFDSPTYKLDAYAEQLKKIRMQLPREYGLSVTGLLDWANQAQSSSMMKIGKTVDELVMQTYQGKHTIKNHSAYLQKMHAYPFEFKIGLVEGGSWYALSNESRKLEQNPNFKGYVVFLVD